MKRNPILLLLLAVFWLSGCGMTAQKALQKANEHYARAEYYKAIEYYDIALNKGADPEMCNWKMAESYRMSNRVSMAEKFYERTLKLNPNRDSAIFYYAMSCEADGKYEVANTYFKKYAAVGKNPDLKEIANKELQHLEEIKELLKMEQQYKVKHVNYMNSETPDFLPTLYKGNLVFTSSRNPALMDHGYGFAFSDLWIYKFDGNNDTSGFAEPLHAFEHQDHTHECCATFSPDGNTMVFSRSNDGSRKGRLEPDLFITYFKNGLWTEPVMIAFCEDSAWESSPYFAPDGKTMYFSSNWRKDGQGGNDLYKVEYFGEGQFGPVTNLGPEINSHGNEYAPFIGPDGLLYFSSDGYPGFGGLDQFVAKPDASGKFVIQNMGAPINSFADDFGLMFVDTSFGYFTSNREGTMGTEANDDIFTFKKVVKTSEYNLIVKLFYKDSLNTAILPEDRKKTHVFKNAFITIVDDKNHKVFSGRIDSNGTVKLPALPNTKYHILLDDKHNPDYFSVEGHTKTRLEVPFVKLPEGHTKFDTLLNITACKIPDDITFELEILYDYNKANIRPDAALLLDSVYRFMNQNPGLSFELGSHTDERGDDKYNARLSKARADSAVAYLIKKGISSKRLVAKGYGEYSPKYKNAKTEEEHQANRRTTIKITKRDTEVANDNEEVVIYDENGNPIKLDDDDAEFNRIYGTPNFRTE